MANLSDIIGQGPLGQGKHTIWLPAQSAITVNGDASGTTGVNPAETGEIKPTGSRLKHSTYDFDPASKEGILFVIGRPPSMKLGDDFSAQVYWAESSGATDSVVWGLQFFNFFDEGSLDPSARLQVTVTDSGSGTANDFLISSEVMNLQTATATDYPYLALLVEREINDGSDTLSADARLIGVRLFHIVNAPTDA